MLKCVELLTQNEKPSVQDPGRWLIIGGDPLMISHGLWKLAIWIGEMMINHQFWGSLFKILCHSVIVVAQRGFPYWLMIIHNILRTRASHHNQSTSFISYISIFVMLETIEIPKNDGQVMWNQVKSRFVNGPRDSLRRLPSAVRRLPTCIAASICARFSACSACIRRVFTSQDHCNPHQQMEVDRCENHPTYLSGWWYTYTYPSEKDDEVEWKWVGMITFPIDISIDNYL